MLSRRGVAVAVVSVVVGSRLSAGRGLSRRIAPPPRLMRRSAETVKVTLGPNLLRR